MNHWRLRLTFALCMAASLYAGAGEFPRVEHAGFAMHGDHYIRAVLLAGKFRSTRELNAMTAEDQRNALIVELARRTNQSVAHFQALEDSALAGTGALLVFLRESKIRGDQELKAMGEADLRNAMIAELDPRHIRDPQLRRLDDLGLVRVALGIPP